MIHKTRIISFPRSGHHLLVRGLGYAFENELVYSNYYSSAINMENSPYVDIQKSHDFDLTDEIDPNTRYIVQIRGYELAVESWYKVALSEGYRHTFNDFRAEKSDYFDGFMEKWVTSTNIPDRLTISYNDFVASKTEWLIKAINHISDKELNPHVMNLIRKWELAEKNKYTYEKTVHPRHATQPDDIRMPEAGIW